MSVRAIFFDLGGVILRTEYQAPRQHLADRLNMEYDDLVRLVFESASSREASRGFISTEAHWQAVLKRLKRPASEAKAIRAEFFAGDVLDRGLMHFIRGLRATYKTGLISNAWDDLRAYLEKEEIIDTFDSLSISAEVHAVKPDVKIYQHALEQAKVRANEAVFVDDFIDNIEGCEKVGMHGILFKDSEETIKKIQALL